MREICARPTPAPASVAVTLIVRGVRVQPPVALATVAPGAAAATTVAGATLDTEVSTVGGDVSTMSASGYTEVLE